MLFRSALIEEAGIQFAAAVDTNEVTDSERGGHMTQLHRIFERFAYTTRFRWSWTAFRHQVEKLGRRHKIEGPDY